MRLTIWLITTMWLVSCSDGELPQEMPKGLLDMEQLVPIVAEMEVLQSVYNNRLIKNESLKDSLPLYYGQIFSKHDVSRQVFDSSYIWHTSTADRSIVLSEAVIDYLDRWEDGRLRK